jgi:phosphatidylglycerophosphate synthase
MSFLLRCIFEESQTSIFYDKIHKPFYEKVQTIIPSKIHPNILTISSFFTISGLHYYKLYYNPYYSLLGKFMYWTLDGIDGIHARKTNQCSHLGEILDHVIDGYNLILLCDIYFYEINHSKFLQCLLTTNFVFGFINNHIRNKYTGKLILGTKFISINECLVLLMGLPFITNGSYHFSVLSYIFVVLFFCFNMINLYKTYLLEIKKRDMLLVLLTLFFANNGFYNGGNYIYYAGIINGGVVYYLIESKIKK